MVSYRNYAHVNYHGELISRHEAVDHVMESDMGELFDRVRELCPLLPGMVRVNEDWRLSAPIMMEDHMSYIIRAELIDKELKS
jgi:hypothetical protein